MLLETFIEAYERDLKKVITEINLHKTDSDLRLTERGITNAGGNPALQPVGNINHFFGANFGGTNYKRERDHKFSDKNVSRQLIIEKPENATVIFRKTLYKLSEVDLEKNHPEELGGIVYKTSTMLISMLSHLHYHIGQINYHRRYISV